MFEPTDYAARELQSILRDETTTDAVLASQVDVIRSLSVARRIVRQFDLTNREEFAWWVTEVEAAGNPEVPLAGCASRAGSARCRPALGELLAPEAPEPRPSEERAEIAAAEAVRDRMLVVVVRNSRVLTVQFTSEDPQLGDGCRQPGLRALYRGSAGSEVQRGAAGQ